LLLAPAGCFLLFAPAGLLLFLPLARRRRLFLATPLRLLLLALPAHLFPLTTLEFHRQGALRSLTRPFLRCNTHLDFFGEAGAQVCLLLGHKLGVLAGDQRTLRLLARPLVLRDTCLGLLGKTSPKLFVGLDQECGTLLGPMRGRTLNRGMRHEFSTRFGRFPDVHHRFFLSTPCDLAIRAFPKVVCHTKPRLGALRIGWGRLRRSGRNWGQLIFVCARTGVRGRREARGNEDLGEVEVVIVDGLL